MDTVNLPPMASIQALPQRPSSRPVVWWAGLGAFFLVIEAYCLVAWVLSPDFKAVRPGPDPISAYILHQVFLNQILNPAFAAVMALAAYITSRRQGRLSTVALLSFAWLSVWWLDTGISYLRPVYAFNAYFVNRGNPLAQIPFAVNPVWSKMSEPLLMGPPGYFCVNAGLSLLTFGVLRVVGWKFPRLNAPQMVLIGLACGWIFDVILEVTFQKSGVGAYTSVIPSFSFIWGPYYQLAIYQIIYWGSSTALPGILFYFKDANGYTIVERGLDRLKFTKGRQGLRFLAVSAFLHLVLISYSLTYSVTSIYAASFPTNLPSWLSGEECGPGTYYACPGPKSILGPQDRLNTMIPGRDYSKLPAS